MASLAFLVCGNLCKVEILSLSLSFSLQLHDPAPSVKALYPSALCLYGSWLAETRSENPSVIMKSYLEKSVHLMEELREKSELPLEGATVSAYLTLARYEIKWWILKLPFLVSVVSRPTFPCILPLIGEFSKRFLDEMILNPAFVSSDIYTHTCDFL